MFLYLFFYVDNDTFYIQYLSEGDASTSLTGSINDSSNLVEIENQV